MIVAHAARAVLDAVLGEGRLTAQAGIDAGKAAVGASALDAMWGVGHAKGAVGHAAAYHGSGAGLYAL